MIMSLQTGVCVKIMLRIQDLCWTQNLQTQAYVIICVISMKIELYTKNQSGQKIVHIMLYITYASKISYFVLQPLSKQY